MVLSRQVKRVASYEKKVGIFVADSSANMIRKGAEIFSSSAGKNISHKGLFSVAISGGKTPRGMYSLLSKEPCLSLIPWKNTHIFWVDERCVPEDHPESNYGSARKDFLAAAPIPSENLHPIPVEPSPEEGAVRYQKMLSEFFETAKSGTPVFDLIFLGIGKDGHTASIFPGQMDLASRKKWVIAVKGGIPLVDRITMTYSILNHASRIVFAVSGKGKAEILKTIFTDKNMRLPAQAIRPYKGELLWLLDRDSASLLPEKVIDLYTGDFRV